MAGRHKIAGLLVAVVFSTACRLDMHVQPKVLPLRKSDFFADERSARPLIAGTVARGDLRADTYFYTGKIGDTPGDFLPFAVTEQVLSRGRERFNIYCSPCHSRLGDGNGVIPQRGFRRPPSYHIERLRKDPLGYFFDVMTNGFGAMLNYSAQIKPEDRWAIAAYIRVLQLSQDAKVSDVPENERNNIKDAMPTRGPIGEATVPAGHKPSEKDDINRTTNEGGKK